MERPEELSSMTNGYNVEHQQYSSRANGNVVSSIITCSLDQINDALKLPNIIMLGVYGSSNEKKHIVVEKISRRVMKENLFDLIVRASVTKKSDCLLRKKPDLKRIQGELGMKLGLQLLEKSLEGRASLLCNKIKTVNKILIILDDVQGNINIGKIGIPYENNHMGCKVLLISETSNVLLNQTNAQIKLTV